MTLDQFLERIEGNQSIQPNNPFDPFEPFNPIRRRPMPKRPFEINQKKEVITAVRRRPVVEMV